MWPSLTFPVLPATALSPQGREKSALTYRPEQTKWAACTEPNLAVKNGMSRQQAAGAFLRVSSPQRSERQPPKAQMTPTPGSRIDEEPYQRLVFVEYRLCAPKTSKTSAPTNPFPLQEQQRPQRAETPTLRVAARSPR